MNFALHVANLLSYPAVAPTETALHGEAIAVSSAADHAQNSLRLARPSPPLDLGQCAEGRLHAALVSIDRDRRLARAGSIIAGSADGG